MRLLLDSHVLLWALFAPQHLSKPVADVVDDPNASVLVSPVSVFELELKRARRGLPYPEVVDWSRMLAAGGYTVVSLSPEGAQRAARLPRYHNDPWDRFLVAQTLIEGATLASKDSLLAQYGVPVLW